MLLILATETQVVQQLTDDANNEVPLKVLHESDSVPLVIIPRSANHDNQTVTELNEPPIKALA
jgi:hypothetical protein